ncbi:helix-turn-helix transcriptional regulator [Aquabacterium sp.]|uniref:helix-turn-helix transcriptional regulator n=1 Tax=Aquabacterium sp. TaxID=1872578 RepID=UPI0037847D6E
MMYTPLESSRPHPGLGFDPAGALPLLRERGYYSGPERRNAAATLQMRRMAQMVDEVDYGMLLLSDESRVTHANRAARRDLDDTHPLLLAGGELRGRQPHDAVLLRDALAGACQRGLRRLLKLGEGEQRVTVAVVPLPALPGDAQHGVVVVLGKRRMCEELTVDWFARAHSLTMAETAVVKGLCADLTPQQIAQRQGVGLATIRTQIGSIRAKTGSASIRALVRQVAMLPPLVSALHGLGGGMAGAAASFTPNPAALGARPAPRLAPM